ncbi:MAG: DUF2207 domain-containing protein [Acidobacteria bacterium]|nr:DUF2207 domain-containing protein [Acidobacteriota bacterium]MBV9437627.1 DUF2207 domain-containing protein [Acidobacteriota bacterium]
MGFVLIPLMIGVYHLVIWLSRQRAVDDRSIVVRYRPPDGLSPCATRYLKIGDVDWKSLAATLLALSGAGCLRILSLGDTCEVENLYPELSQLIKLHPEEASVFKKLFPTHNRSCVISANTSKEITLELFLNFKSQLQELGYEYNWSALAAVWCGAALSYAWLGYSPENPAMAIVLCGYFAALAVFSPLFWYSASSLRDIAARRYNVRTTLNVLLAAAIMLGFLPALIWAVCSQFAPEFNASLLIGSVALFAGWQIFRRPSAALKTMLDEIEGYRRFLCSVEQDRMERIAAEEGLASWHGIFAYAVALDVKEPVGDAISGALLLEQTMP